MTLRLTSPAKLNLFLHIVGQRADGYHLLQTVFQLLDYGDSMEFSRREDGEIILHSQIQDLPVEDNLVYRAARLLQQQTACQFGATIKLEKHLPMGGGIGGGSSNAATTLLALNQLWNTQLAEAELADLGLQLGADVPVFVRGHSAFAEGIGEILQAIDIPETYYLVIKPGCHVASAQIFSRKELTRDTPAITIAAFFEQGGRNDCENVVRQLYPEVDIAFNWLNQYGQARLTGTGACVFLAFESEAEAQHVFQQLPENLQGFVARGVNISPTHSELRQQ